MTSVAKNSVAKLFDSEPVEVGEAAGLRIRLRCTEKADFCANPFAGLGFEFISNVLETISIDAITEFAAGVGGRGLNTQENRIRLYRLFFDYFFNSLLQGVADDCPVHKILRVQNR